VFISGWIKLYVAETTGAFGQRSAMIWLILEECCYSYSWE
jgi:hypothetical protein